MNQARRILRYLRVANSLGSSKLIGDLSLPSRVNPFQFISASPSTHSLTSLYAPNAQQNLYFSSKPESILEIMLSSNGSMDIEKELSELNSSLTHESVLYVLKKLEKDPEKASNFFKWAMKQNGSVISSATYSLMLRIYADKRTMMEFWRTITEMKEKGFQIDGATYNTLFGKFRGSKMEADAIALRHFHDRMVQENAIGDVVTKVIELVSQTDWGNEVEAKLGEMELSVNDNFILKVLMELKKVGSPLKALSFFRWVGDTFGYKHSSVTYNAIVRVLCREESIIEFWKMENEMKDIEYEMDIDTYIKISRQFQKSGMLRDAVLLYEHMMDSSFKPSIGECNLLLRAIAARIPVDLDLLYRVVNKYEQDGNALSKSLYDVIHRALTSLGHFSEAEKILKVMKDAGFQPDNITYSQLIFGLCKAGKLEEACQVLEAMEREGCIPDIKTWTILIQGHCNANEVGKALICFANMVEKNVEADGDILDVLLNGFLSQRKVDGAYKLFIEMVNIGRVRPWQATYKRLILELLKGRKFEEALDLLRKMKMHNYPPFAEPFIQHIPKFGTVEDALTFLKTLSVKAYPSVSVYSKIFESFFEEGRHSEANDLLYKCPHHIRKHKEVCRLFG